jgi:hypothetical protein
MILQVFLARGFEICFVATMFVVDELSDLQAQDDPTSFD